MEDFRDLYTPTVAGLGATRVRAAWEPALNDMLADPITQLLMRRDGVKEAEVRRLAERLRQARTDR
ncbi:MAG TPA: hypothetical protein VKZ87_10295 [Ferrovibrio sp.]|jgi:hypothetical protein|uniref:hypothetical protein n=1 Tax=Ferrovibrio sp. TaxID=1917215 RepID=UPI002B4B5E21|nr:hypothetical protein [Ferrovibrio sp.]HLT77767.1 hypothetical protein [Ferrovibrio sp.]